jgi:hypothetical protein
MTPADRRFCQPSPLEAWRRWPNTINNIGDAVTAIPLWVAFMLTRRKPNKTFTCGLARVENLAGFLIVLIVLFSAIVAATRRSTGCSTRVLPHSSGWIAIAGIIGFIGNEAVAMFRSRVSREINSAALVADGYHARTDGSPAWRWFWAPSACGSDFRLRTQLSGSHNDRDIRDRLAVFEGRADAYAGPRRARHRR